MKLELKHLAPYLPYSLKVIMEGKKCNIAWMSTKYISVIRPTKIGEIKRIKWDYAPLNLRAILRPLTDLTKEIEHSGERFVPIDSLSKITTLEYDDGVLHQADWDGEMQETEVEYLCYAQFILLLEWHFDVFGLIDAGLAIDINTVEK